MCTKCTLACRGGGGVSFRESFAAGAQACGMCRRKTQAARCMVACSLSAPGGREGLWTHRLYYRYTTVCPVAARTRPHPPPRSPCALRMPMCPCGFLSLVFSVGSPLATCALPKGVYYLNLTLYTIRYAERSAGFLRLRALRFLQSTVAREDGLSVSFRQLYVNLTEPSLSSGNNVINSTGPVVVRLAERAKTNVNVNNGVRYGRDREITD